MSKYDSCKCGNRKRSCCRHCRDCSYRNPSTKQIQANQAIGEARRIRFEDLTESHFTRDNSGRFRTHFWPEGARKRRKLYRYQWVWILAWGPIPEGFDVHHKDGICDRDELGNLELKTHSEHTSHHMRKAHPNRKVTNELRQEILSSAENGPELARRLRLNRSTINRLRRRSYQESEAVSA